LGRADACSLIRRFPQTKKANRDNDSLEILKICSSPVSPLLLHDAIFSFRHKRDISHAICMIRKERPWRRKEQRLETIFSSGEFMLLKLDNITMRLE
jgi:hypothetical protein